jgi:lysophospholipase L1-like esterase
LEDTADLEKARIVTVTIGGNDLGFADILANCIDVVQYECNEHSTDGWIANLQGNIGKLQPFLEKTYRQIESQTSNAAALYVVGYPDLLPQDASQAHQTACAFVTGIPEYGISYLIANQRRLSETVQRAAENARAHFVDPNSQPAARSFVDHDVCALNSWFNALVVPNPEYSFHPNPAGQNALAEDVEAAITDDSSPSGGGGGCSAGAVARPSGIGVKSPSRPSSALREPSFTIEMFQRICGSSGDFTYSTLIGAVGQTVEYKIVVKNTGNLALEFGALTVAACENIAPSGATDLAVGSEESFTCTHVLAGTYTNEASIAGNEGTGTKTSNKVTVKVP